MIDIELSFKPSSQFITNLAHMERLPVEREGEREDWGNQLSEKLSKNNGKINIRGDLNNLWTEIALNDLYRLSTAMLTGNFPEVQKYLKGLHFAFVIGFPRSGGSYLTKELIRAIGIDHKTVPHELAHDGYPYMEDTWFDLKNNEPTSHLKEKIFSMAEYLVIANMYYRKITPPSKNGIWLVPKKMPTLTSWAGSMKTLLGYGNADYLVTVRHPIPAAISVYEKSGGLPSNGKFPFDQPRSNIEFMMLKDMAHLGYSPAEMRAMDYFEAVMISWSNYYGKMATSGLFLGKRDEVRLIPYSKASHESISQEYRLRYGRQETTPESFQVFDKTKRHSEWIERGDDAVETIKNYWKAMGLCFPELTLD